MRAQHYCRPLGSANAALSPNGAPAAPDRLRKPDRSLQTCCASEYAAPAVARTAPVMSGALELKMPFHSPVSGAEQVMTGRPSAPLGTAAPANANPLPHYQLLIDRERHTCARWVGFQCSHRYLSAALFARVFRSLEQEKSRTNATKRRTPTQHRPVLGRVHTMLADARSFAARPW